MHYVARRACPVSWGSQRLSFGIASDSTTLMWFWILWTGLNAIFNCKVNPCGASSASDKRTLDVELSGEISGPSASECFSQNMFFNTEEGFN